LFLKITLNVIAFNIYIYTTSFNFKLIREIIAELKLHFCLEITWPLSCFLWHKYSREQTYYVNRNWTRYAAYIILFC